MVRVIEPKQLEERRTHRSKKHTKKRRKYAVSFAVFGILFVYVLAVVFVPIPSIKTEMLSIEPQPQTPLSMPWPTSGQAAVGAVGYGILDQHGEQKQLPVASVAKVITAVAVLKVKPIQPGDQGEPLVITEEDVQTYRQYISEGQSVVEVAAGEQLTQYQALQALMLPSANNMAEVLARWAFGSLENYLAFVNPFTKTLGMQNTVVADASGYNPGTMSTAVDLTKLAEIAMNNPILAEIVAQPEADLPAAGIVYNVNNYLGTNGIIGIKTGNTDEAGGCYMFAAKRNIDAANAVVVVGVVLGAASRAQAMTDSLPLIDETFKGFKTTQPVATDQKVGTLKRGGESVDVNVRQGVSVVTWDGQIPKITTKAKDVGSGFAAGDEVGTLTVQVGSMSYETSLVAKTAIEKQSLLWRLSHAGGYL